MSKNTTYTCDFCGRSSGTTNITHKIELKLTIGGWISSILEQKDICYCCSRMLTSPSPHGYDRLKDKLKKEFLEYFNKQKGEAK